jgi:hypothetical protein
VLDEDPLQMSTINTESFVDEQEWKLYDEVQIIKGSVVRFFQLDTTETLPHSFVSCRTNASRRYGFYMYSVFLIMVGQAGQYSSLSTAQIRFTMC